MWPYVTQWPMKIGTYGVMMAVGFLTALWLLQREFARRRLDPKLAENVIFLGIVGGVVGAKLAYMFTEADHPSLKDFFSGAGLTWHGGLILAAILILVYFRRKKIPILVGCDAVAPMLASGYAFGRIGCQLAGDGDYGLPCGDFVNKAACYVVDVYQRGFDFCWSKVPPLFCMSYPDGIVPTTQLVHPTPVYEATTNFALFFALWKVRDKFRRPGVLFALYLIGAGVLRFAIEFVRQPEGRPYRFWGLRDAQIIAFLEIALGIFLWLFVTMTRRNVGPDYGIVEPESPQTKHKKRVKRRAR